MRFGGTSNCRFGVMLRKINVMPLAHDWWKDPIFTATVVLAVFLHIVILTLQFAMPQNDAAV